MRNRSIFNNDYFDGMENSYDDFSMEENFLEDIRFNHDLDVDETYNNHDYTIYVHARANRLAAKRR
ncbi:hypothetical protein TDB9533_02492 [Thalassocella blandensis]|nr:hypothetical protein TDB9533_02492 [Thalassocella blandensis]